MIRPCSDADISAIEAIINESARRYEGSIPPDCWHEPYMPRTELMAEIDAGVRFSGFERAESLVGVMGVQLVRGVTLIRHAYVLPVHQGTGIGRALLDPLIHQRRGPMFVGTWADASWAIRFYQQRGFQMVKPEEQKNRLIRTYWNISPRQREVSVVLRFVGEGTWRATGDRH